MSAPPLCIAHQAWAVGQAAQPEFAVQGSALRVALRRWAAGEMLDASGPEEMGAVLEGRFELLCEEDRHELAAGQGALVPQGAPHRWRALQDGILYQVFGPAEDK